MLVVAKEVRKCVSKGNRLLPVEENHPADGHQLNNRVAVATLEANDNVNQRLLYDISE